MGAPGERLGNPGAPRALPKAIRGRFLWILETISPYQNFDATKDYPVPFFVTSTKDDRVHPGHARKMAAKFEAAGLPFYYYENIDGGHSAAANQKERAKRSALEFTYLTKRLGRTN